MPRYRTTEIPAPATRCFGQRDPSRLQKIILSPDGKILAGRGIWGDPRISLWNVDTGALTGMLVSQGNAAFADLVFSQDGCRLYTTCVDSICLDVWDMATCTKSKTPRLRSAHYLRALAISQNGTMAVGNSHEAIHILPSVGETSCEVTLGKPLRIDSLVFSQDGSRLAVRTNGARLFVFTRTEGSWQRQMWRFDRDVWTLAFTPDGQHLLCGTEAGHFYKVALVRGSTPERLDHLEAHLHRGIHCLHFADETTLLVGQRDTKAMAPWQANGSLAVVSWPEGTLLWEMADFYGGSPNSLCLIDDGRRLLMNRTPGSTAHRHLPTLLDFGDASLGRGARDNANDAPP